MKLTKDAISIQLWFNIQETEIAVQEKEAALEETRQAQEMVEEMISSQNNNQPDTKLIEVW